MYTHVEGSAQVKYHFILQECLLAFYFFFPFETWLPTGLELAK